jgi:hypothetical protein
MSGSERRPGRLGPYVEGYRDRLLELGYTPLSVSSYSLVALGQLGRWMASEDLDVDQLDGRAIKAFLATRRTKDHRPAATASFVPLLDYLRDEGVTPPEPARALTPLDGLIGEYRDWLIVDRALAPATVGHRQRFARRFLAERITPEDDLGVKSLTSAAVTAFLLRECDRLKLSSVECYANGLRSLLRFLHVRGYTAHGLVDCVPSVASWREAGIPKVFPRVDIDRLLQSCERSSLSGARDFAILSLLSRLGLRTVEVSRLQLADLHWRAGEIEVDVARPIAATVCRCQATWARLWWTICRCASAAIRAGCSSPFTLRSGRSNLLGSGPSCGKRAGARVLRQSGLTGCAMPWRARCCAKMPRCPTSARCSATRT